MKKFATYWSCLLLVIAICHGCAISEPNDIRLTSIDVFDKAHLIEHMDERGAKTPFFKIDAPYFKVEFDTQNDLLSFINENDVTLFSSAYFCELPNSVVSIGFPIVYFKGQDVMMLAIGNNDAHLTKSGDRFVYAIFLKSADYSLRKVPEALKNDSEQAFYRNFDLADSSRDVCFELHGGSMMSSYKSNTVRIAGELISKSLANYLEQQSK